MNSGVIIARRVGLAAILVAVIARGIIALYWSDSFFNADHATIGLMAKHIAEGRAFPVMQYGAQYVLVLEAWLAAPLMMFNDHSPTVLTAVPVLLNVVTAVLLYLMLSGGDLRLPAGRALVAALPVALPSVSAATDLSLPLGMNIEPLLWSLLLWLARRQPIALGAIAAIGIKNREFVLYAVAALLLMDILRDRSAALWRPRVFAVVSFGVTWALIGVLMEYSTPFGPHTNITMLADVGDNMSKAVGTLCIAPATIPPAMARLVTELLPYQYGVRSAPEDVTGPLGVATVDALWLWPLLVVGLAAAMGRGLLRAARQGASPATWFGGYLLLIGLQAVIVYASTRCGNVGYETLRYTLLSLFIPTGALVLAIERENHAIWRRATIALATVWLVICAAGYVRRVQLHIASPPARSYAELTQYLEREGIRFIVTDYWTGYHVAFLSGERIRAQTGFDRVHDYRLAVEANLEQAAEVRRTTEPPPCHRAVQVGAFYVCRR